MRTGGGVKIPKIVWTYLMYGTQRTRKSCDANGTKELKRERETVGSSLLSLSSSSFHPSSDYPTFWLPEKRRKTWPNDRTSDVHEDHLKRVRLRSNFFWGWKAICWGSLLEQSNKGCGCDLIQNWWYYRSTNWRSCFFYFFLLCEDSGELLPAESYPMLGELRWWLAKLWWSVLPLSPTRDSESITPLLPISS